LKQKKDSRWFSFNWENLNIIFVSFSDPLTALIDLQGFDGYFSWGRIITEKTGKSKDDLKKEFAESSDDKFWITVLVVAILEAMDKEKDLWELVVAKARKALNKDVDKQILDKLFAKANMFII